MEEKLNIIDECTGVIQIHEEGRRYKTKLTKKYAERKVWKEPNPNAINSIIPGSVSEILVKEGDKVKRGDNLLIYEAMKMKNIIVSPFDAKILKVNIEIGSKLPKGHLLIMLEAE